MIKSERMEGRMDALVLGELRRGQSDRTLDGVATEAVQ